MNNHQESISYQLGIFSNLRLKFAKKGFGKFTKLIKIEFC
ncbi:hypothetical protein THERMOT_1916 [Bathymodiolus thermophilus thioautotrophic gill symbiont]|nr:hypothetical protein THERMOT_1916 [Bathymodiolus thermophilus thioautotrophic gill symbiont]